MELLPLGYGTKVLLREDNVTWSPGGAYGHRLPKKGELILTDASIVFLWDQKGIRSETKGVCVPLAAIPIVGGDAAVSVHPEAIGDHEYEYYLRVHSGTAPHYFKFDRSWTIGKWIDSVNELLTGKRQGSSKERFGPIDLGRLSRIIGEKLHGAAETDTPERSMEISSSDNPGTSFVPMMMAEGDTFRTGDASYVGNLPQTPGYVDLGVAAHQIEGLRIQGILTEEEYGVLLQRIRDAVQQ